MEILMILFGVDGGLFFVVGLAFIFFIFGVVGVVIWFDLGVTFLLVWRVWEDLGVFFLFIEGNVWFDKLELDILDREDGEIIFEVIMFCFFIIILLDVLVVVKLMFWFLNGRGVFLFLKD